MTAAPGQFCLAQVLQTLERNVAFRLYHNKDKTLNISTAAH